LAKKKRRKTTYCRLDKRERKAIEHGLDKGDSCRSMARDLGRSASTIHDEVVRNRVVTRGPGKGDNVAGTSGEQAGDARVCPRLLGWPYCCNGCKYRRYHCSYRWRCEYVASSAQGFADEDLVEPRRGVDMDRERFEAAVSLIREDLARGLSPQQIAEARAEQVGVSKSTIYRWVDEGYGGMSNAELRRKVGYKPRRRERAKKATHHGEERSYEAFLRLPEDERARACEMDTVVGGPTDSQCLLTLFSRACRVQLPLLMPGRTKAATVDKLDEVERAIGLDAFRRLLGLVLTDNGGEFEDAEGIERSCTVEGERRCRVYYCDPMQSQQKGSCERNHVEIRKLLPKGRGISFDDLDEVDAWFVGSNVNSEPRPSLMGLSPIAMLRAADPDLADALADKLGICELPYDELDLTLSAVNRERAGRGLAPLA
jgi:IS30 family transposase